MPYCTHCGKYVLRETTCECQKSGLLGVDKNDSMIVSTVIGAATGSLLLGGLLGGNLLGGILGDSLDGDLFD